MIAISDIAIASNEDWEQIWNACPWSVFSESPEWAEVWIKTFPGVYKAEPLLLTFTDGVRVLIPLLRGKRAGGLIRHYEAAHAGTSGGPIASHAITSQHLIESLHYLMKARSNVYIRLNPYLLRSIELNTNELRELTESSGLFSRFSVHPDFTQSLDLTGNFTDLESKLRKKHVLRDANKARRLGFSIKPIRFEELPEFFDVYEDVKSRWKMVRNEWPLKLFESLWQSDGCTFHGVYDGQGKLLGGGPFLHSKYIVTSYLTIMSTNKLKYRINEFIYKELAYSYRESGYKWLDFNPSGGNKGVVDFKDRFMPDRLDSPFLSQESGLVHLINRIRKVPSA